MGHGQVFLDPKTKAWVDEQNKINKEERPRYGRLYNEGEDLIYPDPQLDVGAPIKGQKEGTTATLEKEQDAPQPSCALQEFVKHIANPLVDKGWNLHLKFGKGKSQEEQFVQGSSPWKPTNKTNKKEKISKPQIGKQIPLKMGTGGGGGKKGGSGGRKPPEDKVEMENYPNEDEEDDSSSETSLELDVNPQQLASVGLDRPLLRLRLTPRRRVVAAAPGGGGTPPPLGGGTKTVPPQEGQNGRGSDQPVKGGGGPPQPPNGGGGGIGPPFLERGGRMPQ